MKEILENKNKLGQRRKNHDTKSDRGLYFIYYFDKCFYVYVEIII